MARGRIKWRLEMRTYITVAALGLAFGVIAMSPSESRAQEPQDYRYCALDAEGGTDCYFNSRAQCRIEGSNRCIENPGYVGNANASESNR
jgi:Protein of unknown function (DUF3551)